MEQTVHTRVSRPAIKRAIAALPEAAKESTALLVRVGIAALGRIKQAFVVKSRGGTDEAGDRWAPLSPRTVAYGRRHPGLRRDTYGMKRPSSALTAKQRERWWYIYHNQKARFKGNKGQAARVAWAVLKREGAKTIFDKYAGAQVEILRDTGLLLNSLSPGYRGSEQVLHTVRGVVVVGTNRKGATRHHNGDPSRNLPQRRLWPPPSRWPQSWWRDILEQVKQGILDIATKRTRSTA